MITAVSTEIHVLLAVISPTTRWRSESACLGQQRAGDRAQDAESATSVGSMKEGMGRQLVPVQVPTCSARVRVDEDIDDICR